MDVREVEGELGIIDAELSVVGLGRRLVLVEVLIVEALESVPD